MTPDAADGFNLYLDTGLLDARQCGELIAELSVAPEAPATLYGQGKTARVDERARKVARLMPASETIARITSRLHEARKAIAAHFGLPLKGFEEPQFLRYRAGDFFVAHQDGNTGMLLGDREQVRKVSVVLFLNRQSEAGEAGTYGGGSLVFSEWRAGRKAGRYALSASAGSLVAFTSDTTHEVTPVTFGDRYSIVSWLG